MGSRAIVEFLILKGVNVNARDCGKNKQTPLMYTLRYGHKDVAELLIAKGADVNARDK